MVSDTGRKYGNKRLNCGVSDRKRVSSARVIRYAINAPCNLYTLELDAGNIIGRNDCAASARIDRYVVTHD